MKEELEKVAKEFGEQKKGDGFLSSLVQGAQNNRFSMRIDIGFGMFTVVEGPIEHREELCAELQKQAKWLFDYLQEQSEEVIQKQQSKQKIIKKEVGKKGYA
jgi:hypothetical protein